MNENKNNQDVITEDLLNLETYERWVNGLIYCIVNETTKKVHICYTKNLMLSLGRLLENVKIDSGEVSSLKVEIKSCIVRILETEVEESKLRLKTSQWMKRYKEEGYTFYKETNPIEYKILKEVKFYNMRYNYYVYLENISKTDKILIGIFRKKKDADKWILSVYGEKTRNISEIVKHKSVLTTISKTTSKC